MDYYNPKIIGIIPSRLASKRLPGKPMADILGIPMIGHVYLRSKYCSDLSELYVATPDQQIADYIKSIGGKVVMTGKEHLRSSDRVAEALLKIEELNNTKYDIVVMIQGDEPMVNETMIANTISPLFINNDVQITHLMTEITNEDEIEDPNAIKVVVDINNFALYMSRSPIPFQKWHAWGLPVLKKVNVVAFRRDFLLKYASMDPTPLEIMESIGMLRLLENGYKIKMVLSEEYTVSVDTPKDLKIVRDLMKNDYYLQRYITNYT